MEGSNHHFNRAGTATTLQIDQTRFYVMIVLAVFSNVVAIYSDVYAFIKHNQISHE